MNARDLLLCIVLLLPLYGCGGRAQENSASVAEPVVQAAVKVINAETTTRLEIFSFPREILTRADLSPQLLEKAWLYKFVVKDFSGSPLQRDLAPALRKSAIRRRATADADFRWACIFYDGKGTRVLAMYFDGFGTKGLIAGVPVTANGRLVKLLERRCSCLWE